MADPGWPLSTDVDWLKERHDWPGLQGVVMVESAREIEGRIERETRFFITSLACRERVCHSRAAAAAFSIRLEEPNAGLEVQPNGNFAASASTAIET